MNKFNAKDEVFYVKDGSLRFDTITWVHIGSNNSSFSDEVKYSLFNDSKFWYDEKDLFTSKEEAVENFSKKLLETKF